MQHNDLIEGAFFFLSFCSEEKYLRYFELLGGQKTYLNSFRPTAFFYHGKRRMFLYLSIAQAASTSQEMRQGSCSLVAGVAKPAPAAKHAHFSLDTTPPFAIPLSATELHCDRLWRGLFKPCLLNAHQIIKNISVILSGKLTCGLQGMAVLVSAVTLANIWWTEPWKALAEIPEAHTHPITPRHNTPVLPARH